MFDTSFRDISDIDNFLCYCSEPCGPYISRVYKTISYLSTTNFLISRLSQLYLANRSLIAAASLKVYILLQGERYQVLF